MGHLRIKFAHEHPDQDLNGNIIAVAQAWQLTEYVATDDLRLIAPSGCTFPSNRESFGLGLRTFRTLASIGMIHLYVDKDLCPCDSGFVCPSHI
jgi:hypothetical protein